MVASFSLLVMLLLSLAGSAGNDIVALLPAEDYFQSRNIDMSADKLMELAGKDPVDGKTSIQQLLALRLLGEDPAKVKKAPNFAGHIDILRDIAAGKKAQDKLGFAKEYAAWVVDVLSDTKPPARMPPAKTLAQGSLDCFPDKVGLVGALDLARPDGNLGLTKEVRALISAAAGQIPVRSKTEIYAIVEAMGNIRVDRFSFAYVPDPINRDERIYVRLSGKGDHNWITALIRKKAPNQMIEKMKGPKDEPITIFPGERFDPAMALIGDGELILAASKLRGVNQSVLVKELLEIRAGKKASVLREGTLAGEIKKVSDNVHGLLVGRVPPELVNELEDPNGPFKMLPTSVIFEAQRKAGGLELRFQGKTPNADAAKDLFQDLLVLRGRALFNLKLKPDAIPLPAEPILKTLSAIKMEPKGDMVIGTAQISSETISAMVMGFTKLLKETPRRD